MRLLLILSALLLTGCNMVVTASPLLRAGDGRALVHPRPGVWLTLEDGCRAFDAAAARESWPSCAGIVVMADGAVVSDEGGRLTAPMPLLIVRGDPTIGQARLPAEEGAPPQGALGGSAESYLYLGVEVTARDAAGRATAMSLWPVQCDASGRGASDGSLPLFAGLTRQGRNCTTSAAAALRGAARESRAAGTLMTMRWLREPR